MKRDEQHCDFGSMADNKYVLLIVVGGTEVEGYSKTEGAWILSMNRRQYSVNEASQCATKCDSETLFTCRCVTFMFAPTFIDWFPFKDD